LRADEHTRATVQAPTLEQTTDALEELTDVLIAAQESTAKFRDAGWPFRAFCARELEDDCHTMFHQIELVCSGWEPVNHAER
jgi:hypothetical protein